MVCLNDACSVGVVIECVLLTCMMFASSARMQLARNRGSNTTCRFWNFTADGEYIMLLVLHYFVHVCSLVEWVLQYPMTI